MSRTFQWRARSASCAARANHRAGIAPMTIGSGLEGEAAGMAARGLAAGKKGQQADGEETDRNNDLPGGKAALGYHRGTLRTGNLCHVDPLKFTFGQTNSDSENRGAVSICFISASDDDARISVSAVSRDRRCGCESVPVAALLLPAPESEAPSPDRKNSTEKIANLLNTRRRVVSRPYRAGENRGLHPRLSHRAGESLGLHPRLSRRAGEYLGLHPRLSDCALSGLHPGNAPSSCPRRAESP